MLFFTDSDSLRFTALTEEWSGRIKAPAAAMPPPVDAPGMSPGPENTFGSVQLVEAAALTATNETDGAARLAAE